MSLGITKNTTKAYLFLTFAALFWSGNFIVGKAASIYEIPPFSLNFYRWLFAFLILLPFTYKEVIEKKEYVFQNLGFFIALGITSITIFNSIVYYSLYYTQVISGVLMISTIPVWIMFIATILKIEKTNSFQIIGVILSLTGVLFIITKADLEIVKNLNFNKGDLSMVVAMFAWAIYSALLRKKTHPISQMALLEVIIICGFVFLIPIYFIEMSFGSKIVLGMPFILTLGYVVLFPGIFAFLFWIKGIDIIGANRAGVFLHLMPIFGALMAMIIFDEKFMFYHFLGAIFIIAGITLSNKIKKNA
jgi:drug/metabolite transporter (DMT)-like permease